VEAGVLRYFEGMKMLLKYAVLILLLGVLIHLSCKKEYSCEGCRGDNKPPIANAGPDYTITLPTDSAILDGSGSSDPDGMISEWLWTKISGPDSFNVLKPADSIAKVKALSVGTYQLELKVTDNGGLSAKDTLTLIVDSVLTSSHPPVANAGADQTISLPSNTVSLDGSGSTDPENNITNYTWTKISGPATFSITNPGAVQTQLNNLVQGVYQLELKVTDNEALSSKDTMQVNVTGTVSRDSIYIAGCNASLITFGHLSSPAIGTQLVSASSKIFFSWYDVNSSGTNVYDTITKTWTATRQGVGNINVGNKLIEATYTFPVNNEIFEVYDVASNSRTNHTVPEARAFIQHDLTENKLIFAGGFYPDYSIPGASKRIDIYDNASNSWSLVNYDSASRSTGIAAFDNKIFLFGSYVRVRLDTLICGLDDDGNYSCHHPSYPDPKMDIYDMSTNTWSTKYLTEAKGNIRTAKLGNKLYLFQSNSSKIDVYDASTQSWTVEVKNDEFDWSRIHVVGNKVLFTGFWSNRVGLYDVITHNWSIKQMAKPNAQTDYLVASAGNKILFLYVFDYEDISTAIDTYDANTNTWCHGELSQGLVRSAIGVAGNKIYIAGGVTKTKPGAFSDKFLDDIWIFSF